MASLPQKCLQFPSLWIFPSLFNRSACLYNLLCQEVNNEVSWQLFHWTSQSCAVIYYLLAQTKAQKLRGKLVLRNLLLVAINFQKKRANQLVLLFCNASVKVNKSTSPFVIFTFLLLQTAKMRKTTLMSSSCKYTTTRALRVHGRIVLIASRLLPRL